MKQGLPKTMSRALLLVCLMCAATSMSAEKVLIDGRLFILSQGHTFDVLGNRIK